MTPEQRKAYVDQHGESPRRHPGEDQIALRPTAKQFIAEKRRETAAAAGKQTLDAAILSAVDEQMKAKRSRPSGQAGRHAADGVSSR
jgi:hypothetical protein